MTSKAPSSFEMFVVAAIGLGFVTILSMLLYAGSLVSANGENVAEHRHANQRDHDALLEQCRS